MGGLDEQGYLFISGRTKEIINRGGETISPFEIEEAVVQHPFVKETLAFAAPHESYQETIGAVIVTQKGQPRVDLPTLHAYLESRLHRSKWPQVLVYSDSLPKNATGKVLRIKFAERTQMKAVDEEAPPHTRLFEMECPAMGSPLSQQIELVPVQRDLYRTFTHLLTKRDVVDVAVLLVNVAQWQSAVVAFVVLDEKSSAVSLDALKDGCALALHQYEVPQFLYQVREIPYLPPDSSCLSPDAHEVMSSKGSSKGSSSKSKKKSRHSTGSSQDSPSQPRQQGRDITQVVDDSKLTALAIKLHAEQNVVAPRTPIESQVELVWRSVLQLNGAGIGTGATCLSVVTSFFDLGGDSLKAGQLVNVMRKQLKVQLTVADLFTAPTIEKISRKIATLKALGTPDISSMRQSGTARHAAREKERGAEARARKGRANRIRSASEAVSEAAGESTVWLDKSSAKVIPSYGAVMDGEGPGEEDRLLGRLSEGADDTQSLQSGASGDDPHRDDPFFSWEFAPSRSSTSFICLFTQSLPILLIYPLRRIVIWFLIAAPWVYLMKIGYGRWVKVFILHSILSLIL